MGLSDGRTLSYSDTGSGEKGTWIHCHGIPGSRFELNHLNNQLGQAGLRVITPDRPGFGQSTAISRYGFADHSDDLRQLADYLVLGNFGITGFSGGGVFALATAYDLAPRVDQVAIAGTPAVPFLNDPYDRASELTANTWRAALQDQKGLAAGLKALTGSAGVLSDALIGAGGAQERRYLMSGQVYSRFMESLTAALEQGAEASAVALARDSFLTASSWPFEPGDINVPVRLIHGREDGLVYREHCDALAERLLHARPELFSGGGHFESLSRLWSHHNATPKRPTS